MALRNRSGRRKRRLMSEMNVVPYIDVMLVLVVILMVAAPFVNPSVVNLPSVRKAGKAPAENIQVVVHADSRLSIKTKSGLHPVDMPQLVNNVKTAQAGLKTPVVIAADRDVRYEQVIDVMKALQSAEVERVGLALQIEGARR
jgi:tolR protein